MSSENLEQLRHLNGPLYNFAEADRLANATRGTASRWLKGYNPWGPQGKSRMPPVTKGVREYEEAVSFFDLIEILMINKLKGYGISLPRVRQFVEHCQEELRSPRPLVTESFKTDGREIFVSDEAGTLLHVGKRSVQLAWDQVLDPFLATLDYSSMVVDYSDVAYRWWPLGREANVLIDPEYGFGLPTIAETGVRTEIIAERYSVNEGIEEIAKDFRLETWQVESALRYELQLNAA